MNRVGRTRWNQTYVNDRAGRPSVPLVDRVPVPVNLQRPVEMRAGIHWAFAAIGNAAILKNCLTLVVRCSELDPAIERIYRAARKEMAKLTRADHYVHTI